MEKNSQNKEPFQIWRGMTPCIAWIILIILLIYEIIVRNYVTGFGLIMLGVIISGDAEIWNYYARKRQVGSHKKVIEWCILSMIIGIVMMILFSGPVKVSGFGIVVLSLILIRFASKYGDKIDKGIVSSRKE